ncbi:MAG TPA: hypothetical protein VHN15_01105 [Thermoanaerobaculia bacterium]|nr:hypothetical protein [Thermoanaerobaculia bacterium]
MVKKAAVWALALTLGFSAADVALACSCAPLPPPQEARDQATAVFTGTVVSITPDATGNYNLVRFQVAAGWKGVKCREVTVFTGSSDLNCGYNFVVGGTYLVYAYEDTTVPGVRLNTNLCTRTRLIVEAGEDLAALGTPTETCKPK